jgi:serine/threonine protein kinase
MQKKIKTIKMKPEEIIPVDSTVFTNIRNSRNSEYLRQVIGFFANQKKFKEFDAGVEYSIPDTSPKATPKALKFAHPVNYIDLAGELQSKQKKILRKFLSSLPENFGRIRKCKLYFLADQEGGRFIVLSHSLIDFGYNKAGERIFLKNGMTLGRGGYGKVKDVSSFIKVSDQNVQEEFPENIAVKSSLWTYSQNDDNEEGESQKVKYDRSYTLWHNRLSSDAKLAARMYPMESLKKYNVTSKPRVSRFFCDFREDGYYTSSDDRNILSFSDGEELTTGYIFVPNHPGVALSAFLPPADSFVAVDSSKVKYVDYLTNKITGDAILNLIILLASEVRSMHAKGIIHGDIKLDNFIVQAQRKKSGSRELEILGVKLIDFAGSHLKNDTHTRVIYTEFYAAPELLSRGDIKSDIYSLGKTIKELFVVDRVSHAFDDCNSTDKYKTFKEMLDNCCSVKKDDRPELNELIDAARALREVMAEEKSHKNSSHDGKRVCRSN